MENTTLGKICNRLDSFVAEVQALKLAPLGPEFKDLSVDDLRDSLVSHRILKNYEVPSSAKSDARKQLSIDEVIEADRNGYVDFTYRDLPIESRRDFLASKAWLADLFKDFNHTYKVRFPSGETFVGARGKTDLFFKLRDATQWQISPDLVDYVVNILMRHRGLLAVVKQRYKEKYGERGRVILEKLRLAHVLSFPDGSVHKLRKSMIHFQFRAVVQLNRTSRVTTVPKDNNRDRVITCESLWTMVAQLSFAHSLRQHLLNKLGISLDTLQNVHRALIRSGKATIDLSKASDRNFMCVLADLWPPKLFSTLETMRTGIFELANGEFHPLRMFAPMGCGCTFEVMTITLLAHARVLDPGSTVFGDDIIIESSSAFRLMENLENQGWKINVSKSFVDGPFRESCGAYCDLRTDSFILSYDFHRPTNLADCYVIGHKMLHIGDSLANGALRKLFVTYYGALLKLFPRDSLGVIDGPSKRPTAGLSERVFFVPEICYRNRVLKKETSASRVLASYWQRPIGITTVHTEKQQTLAKRPLADRTLYACYMHRNGSYAINTGVKRRETLMIELFAGVPIRDVLLATVL